MTANKLQQIAARFQVPRSPIGGEELVSRDLAMLGGCYITPELAHQAGLFRVDAARGGELIGRNGHGNYSGLVFPYCWPGENKPREYRLRRDAPDLEQQSDGSIKEKGKYLSPPGKGNMLYFPPGVKVKSLDDETLPIIFTEGEKKALALSRLGPGFLPIGLAGVWNWRGVVGKAADQRGARRDVKGVIPDLDRIVWKNRTVHIIFDANVASNDSVKAARCALSKELTRRGAKVRLIDLPVIEGINGVDELLATEGPDYVLDLIENNGHVGHAAIRPAKWFDDQYPLLSEQYGAAVLEDIDKRGVVFVKDVNEDFHAAALGEKGSPGAPTVFLPAEQRHYTYAPEEGIYVQQREAVLQARISDQFLQCSRARESDECETESLAFRFRDQRRIAAITRKTRGLLEVPGDFFATDLNKYVVCDNGVVRLSDGELLPFSPSYRRRNRLAVPFDPSAKCPLFLETLMRPALEPDDIDLVKRWCGAVLIGENIPQKILILIGMAGTGKGTFIRVLIGIIGWLNLASLRPQLLGERFELSRFLDKTLLYGADVPEGFLNQRHASVL